MSAGLLDGPILQTVRPVGRGREDLSSRTGEYDCLAVTEIDDNGTQSGDSFHATINYKEFSTLGGSGGRWDAVRVTRRKSLAVASFRRG